MAGQPSRDLAATAARHPAIPMARPQAPPQGGGTCFQPIVVVPITMINGIHKNEATSHTFTQEPASDDPTLEENTTVPHTPIVLSHGALGLIIKIY